MGRMVCRLQCKRRGLNQRRGLDGTRWKRTDTSTSTGYNAGLVYQSSSVAAGVDLTLIITTLVVESVIQSELHRRFQEHRKK